MEYFDDTTLEEGRIALYQLEKQLRYKDSSLDASDISAGSRQQSLQSERKMLDQVPRDTRLINRLGSPLGHTIEELDDRGMLDGGASVPSYYTSYKQRNRRALEMKKRSSRLQERKKEGAIRHIDSIFHLMRTLHRKGVDIVGKFRIFDDDRTGEISRRSFIKICRQLYLPFTSLELQEFCNRYQLHKTDRIDYISILRDTDLQNIDLSNLNEKDFNNNISDSNNDSGDVMSRVIVNVKKLLLDSITAIEKPIDDVYRMFAKWDTEGTGMITATQFFRVLGKFHISLSDQDQDALIELLDTNGMGRVDIEGLLTYCFVDFFPELSSPQGLSLRSLCGGGGGSSDDSGLENTAGDSGSGGEGSLDRYLDPGRDSIGGGGGGGGRAQGDVTQGFERNFSSNNSISSNDNGRRRPLTASSVRVSDNSTSLPHVIMSSTQHSSGASVGSGQQQKSGALTDSKVDRDSAMPLSMHMHGGGQFGTSGSYSKLPNSRQRPVTASGRVSLSEQHHHQHHHHRKDNLKPESENFVDIEDDGLPYEAANELENPFLENEYAQNNGRYGNNYRNPVPLPMDYIMSHNQEAYDVPDGGSFNDNTLITSEQEEFFMGSPHSPGPGPGRGMWGGLQDSIEDGHINLFQQQQQHLLPSNTSSESKLDAKQSGAKMSQSPGHKNSGHKEDEEHFDAEPRDHLAMLANQILTTVREMVLSRYRIGKPLHEIFRHFDRSGKGFFTAKDFVVATKDLRIEMSQTVAELAIHEIAIDSVDSVTFGEFKVYILDSDHKSLVKNVQQQVAYKLELHGWKYVSYLRNIYFAEESHRFGQHNQRKDIVSTKSFITGIEKLGVRLSPADISRLVARFDILGNDVCYVNIWLSMVTNNTYWKHAEKVLLDQEEAIQEAQHIRECLKNNIPLTNLIPADNVSLITPEVLSMVEYLGIKPISEHHLLWIAANALQAPLPSTWISKVDDHGRTYYFNTSKQQSCWDHPLDPHFRKLRDKYRASDQDSKADDSFVKPITNVNMNSQNNNPNHGYNYNNMGNGGIGSALNPPPLNIKLSLPRPDMNQIIGHQQQQQQQQRGGTGPNMTKQFEMGEEIFHIPSISINRNNSSSNGVNNVSNSSNNNNSNGNNSSNNAGSSSNGYRSGSNPGPTLGPIGNFLQQLYQNETSAIGNPPPVAFRLNNDPVANKIIEIDKYEKKAHGYGSSGSSPYVPSNRPSSANPSSSSNNNSYLRKKYSSISQSDIPGASNPMTSSSNGQLTFGYNTFMSSTGGGLNMAYTANNNSNINSGSGGGSGAGKMRPSSAASSKRRPSTVDRLLGFNREQESGYMTTKGGNPGSNKATPSSSGLIPVVEEKNKKEKNKLLSEMFDDSLVRKLDTTLLSKPDVNSNFGVGGGGGVGGGNTRSKQSGSGAAAKGGIVLL